ncbi:MAG: 30S ribosomal protein S9 [Candidatus Portnoybacteria bacterium CG_4_8_14_3_um_filter_40_10]|uniref:Small ribosomal subunit protein uS9 n=3 Tax=Candidatus Portnoyibacteriota TaxID=1817913 RepID=A0A2M7IJ04_9BACT|nr:MAG: 30S ribosomal protein S9 [Candidatus Portnoybacteria bacterium CG11_big_fil_rev_8_21_14_0_20_40_15]PIS30538.1 MAG: 30S ribosomal protein S9 [Candidatus Portnoybacteria bacterium CG08_land_8_20_14_0_20_40_83]PIW76482.1 MAG: 30S ribosomal protein S9 [Candidatus Portnoybacteria bacterium CG_4_8_14_3_um_filter_40_10]PJA64248.1 MAG: 30S ribosomal protein S9 [Candidatus Portnoybacteria bacterium CG_4_9_14_3_um_filter_40_10]
MAPRKKTVKTKKAPAAKEKKEKIEVAEPEKIDAIDKEDKSEKPKKYYEAVGRRKTAIARVRLFTIRPMAEDEGKISVNEKDYKDYFPLMELQQTVEASLRKLKSLNRFEIIAKVKGGGIHAQAEAIRHGIARTLVKFNIDFRKKLKRAGYLKRDPRMKERKKYGLKAARRAPQWAKR